jgi:hypothetical protein
MKNGFSLGTVKLETPFMRVPKVSMEERGGRSINSLSMADHIY